MSKFERKYGKYAIQNLTTVLIACYAVGYIIQLINSDFLLYLTLDPWQILHGQVWRLFTWVVVPPSMGNLFTTLIMLYFYWSIGTTLEHTWGTYRYNVYLFSGFLFTILGSFLAMGLGFWMYGNMLDLSTAQACADLSRVGSVSFSTLYVNTSIFLAFAATFPDVQVLLMFLIPIKVKWMGIVYGIITLWDFLQGAYTNVMTPLGVFKLDISLFPRIAILASLLNFFVFFFTSRKGILRSPKQIRRQHEYKREVRRNTGAVTRHKCAICGRTDESHPELEFRFCSKCNGNYEYCQDHLFTHTHVQCEK